MKRHHLMIALLIWTGLAGAAAAQPTPAEVELNACLAALLRLLLDRILLNGSGKELKSFAEKIEAELSEVLRPQRGN